MLSPYEVTGSNYPGSAESPGVGQALARGGQREGAGGRQGVEVQVEGGAA